MNRISLLLASLLLTGLLSAQKLSPPPAAPEPKPTPATERLAGLEKRKTTEARSEVTNVAFRNVGPTVMSGRVVDIDVNPNDPTIFYVAYASGGVWFTDNNGTTFSPVFDSQATIDIGDIAVDWNTDAYRGPKQPTIWVGTGECNSSRSSYAGTGVYKSADGGKSWQYKGLPETHHIGKLLISPDDPNTVYVAAIGHLYSPNKERGVFKTADGGETWKQTLFIDENTGVIDLFMDPNNPKNIYATGWHRERRAWNLVESGNSSGIYKSTTSGESWTMLTGPKSNFPQGEGVGRIGLAIFPGNSNIIYASVDNQSVPAAKESEEEGEQPLKPADFRGMTKDAFLKLDSKQLGKYLRDNGFPEKYSVASVTEMVRSGKILPEALADYVSDANADLFSKPIIGAEVYRSDDAGLTWKKVNEKPFEALYYTYGYYFGKIWVSPFDANEVFIGGVELLKSRDGGKSFTSTNGVNQHGDHHALWIDPSRKGHLINGNDGGVNISWDNGANWFKANTPSVGQFYSVAADMAKPYNVYGGLQDNGVWCGPSNYSPSLEWYDDGRYPYVRLLGGDGMQVQVDTRDNNIVYTGYQFGHYFRVNKSTGEQTELHPQMELGEKPLRYNWQAPIWLSAHNQDVLYIGANKLFRSLDQGNHFTAISGDLTRGAKTGDVPYGTISSICESPLKFGLLYTGSDDGLIHVSKDGGNSWTRISDKLPQQMRVNRVIASSHVEGRVYAVLSGFQWDHFKPYLFVSEDYGANWKQIGTDLPMEPLNVVREDPVNENLLFVGTDHGLYTSFDRGASFMRMFNGLPPVAIHDMVIQPREHDLVVGTHGRSIYIAHIGEMEQLNDSMRKEKLCVFEPLPASPHPSYEKINGKGALLAVAGGHLAWYAGETGVVKLRLLSDDGKTVFAEVKDSTEKGLNFYDGIFAVDSLHATDYLRWLGSSDSKQKPVAYHHGTYLLQEGTYLVQVETAAGIKQEVKLTIKPPRFAGNSSGQPKAEPGESGLIDK
jgi:hypothetical protein